MVECKLSLELTKNGAQKSVQAKMGEKKSRKLLITLTEKGKVFDLEGYEARVSYDDKTYTKATIDGNVVEFILPSTLLSTSGERLCELEISVPGESVLYSPMFIVNVEGSLGAEAKNEAVGKDVEYQQVIPDLEETAEMGEETYIAVYEEGKGIKKYKVKGIGGASKHGELSGRDEANQHPMSAITGLDEFKEETEGAIASAFSRFEGFEKGISANKTNTENNTERIEELEEVEHSHSNKATLDRLGVSVGNVLTFDGKEVGTEGGGSGGAVNVSALAPQIVATLLTTSRAPVVFEEPDVASMDTSQFFEKLSMLPDADGMLIYAPGKRGTLQVFDVGFDYSLYGLTVEESGLYVFKCDIPNGGMMQVATAYGETVRQALIQGIESLTFNYLSEVGTLIE